MEDDIGGEAPGHFGQRLVPNVELMHLDVAVAPGLGEPLQLPTAQVVHDQHGGTVVDEPVDQVRSDEPGAAGDQGLFEHHCLQRSW